MLGTVKTDRLNVRIMPGAGYHDMLHLRRVAPTGAGRHCYPETTMKSYPCWGLRMKRLALVPCGGGSSAVGGVTPCCVKGSAVKRGQALMNHTEIDSTP